MGLGTGHNVLRPRMERAAVMETSALAPGALASAEDSSPLPLRPLRGPAGHGNPNVAFSLAAIPHPGSSLGAGTSLALVLGG